MALITAATVAIMPHGDTVKVKTVLREQRCQRPGTLPEPPRLVPKSRRVPAAAPPSAAPGRSGSPRPPRRGCRGSERTACRASDSGACRSGSDRAARSTQSPAAHSATSRLKPEIDKPARRGGRGCSWSVACID